MLHENQILLIKPIIKHSSLMKFQICENINLSILTSKPILGAKNVAFNPHCNTLLFLEKNEEECTNT